VTRTRIPGFHGVVRDDPDARAVYAEAAGIGRILPRAVAVPTDPDDVATLVHWAHAAAVPLIPRGSGSSVAGGAIGPGLIVDCSRLRTRGPIDVTTQSVWVGAGVLCAEVDAAARARGLRFPVDPASAAFCTVGGMAGTNAAGPRTLRYGSMRRWVRALDCVFADGSRAIVRRGEPPPTHVPAIARLLADGGAPLRQAAAERRASRAGVRKDSSGYDIGDYAATRDLVDLLVGSEGTLAVFVGVELALTVAPAATTSLLAAYGSLEGAVLGASAARDAGASACELFDRTFLALVRSAADAASPSPRPPVSVLDGAEAVLLVELEGANAADATAGARRLGEQLRAVGASNVSLALDPAAESALWALRHAANPTLARLDPALKSMQVIEDGCVPPERLPAYVRGVRAALDRQELRGAIFGHAGDAHVHVNPLVDVRDPDWRGRLERLLADVTALTIALGGTLTGEHGDGRLRTPLLHVICSDDVTAEFARIKAAFDPTGILNPGVKIPTPGQQPLEAIKYDPALPALPESAQRALTVVARDRAYATHRLDLLESGQTPANAGPELPPTS
jgi:FAD/FMN-containing dehydrogenase